jgi:hypothetical protein
VVVVSADDRLPAGFRTKRALQDDGNFRRHRPSAGVCEVPCPRDVGEIPDPLVARGIERVKPAANRLRMTEMMVADCRTNPSRSAVDHRPEPAVIIALELDEVVATAERRELDDAFGLTHRIQARMTESRRFQVRWRPDCCAAIPSTSGDSAAEPSEDSASSSRILERGRFHVETGRQHAAADVATDGLGIDQVRRRKDHADTDIRRKMHVWHNGYLLDVR